MGGVGAPTSAALVSGVAELLLEREALISRLKTSGSLFFFTGVMRLFSDGGSVFGYLLSAAVIALAAVFWAQVAALVALTGSRDPSKQSANVNGPAARAILGSAAAAASLSLLCSVLDVGAIEMLVLQIMYNGVVFHFLWHGAVGPSNALVHGDFASGHTVNVCGFCGEKDNFNLERKRHRTYHRSC